MGKTFLDKQGFLYKKRPQQKTFTVPLERTAVQPDYFTDEELYAAKGGIFVFDLEIFPNYFLAAFKCIKTNKVATFELFPGKPVFDQHKLLWVVHNFVLLGFNSNKFDLPILWLALQGGTLDQLNDAVEQIIVQGAMPRDIERTYGFKQGEINSIDLIEVSPLSASLKTYMGRLNAQRLQDLPYNPNHPLTEVEAEHVKLYCVNDLDGTQILLEELCPQLDLRAAMSKEYGIDLRSKSDAQIAEAVICSEVAKINGRWPKRPKIAPGYSFKYNIPDFVKYKTPELQTMLEMVRNTNFFVKDNGSICCDTTLDGFIVTVGNTRYRMGFGGLHSCEESSSHVADENTLLIDRDVASYYPNIILNQELYPKHMGTTFLDVYRNIVLRRLAAKKCGNKVVADSLKICVNGSFGKLNSKYSSLYAPDLLIQVTVSGQLCLLLLIEMIELEDIPVVSGNTDGIVIKCPKSKYDMLNAIIHTWEEITNFETEETRYKALYSKDVNNYLAIKEDGAKAKGAYSKSSLSKNPTSLICVKAVTELIVGNKPIDETIKSCKDISKFVTVRNVKGGAEKNGVYLGKVVRWIYVEKELGTINYVLSGNKVPKSEGAQPLMDLPETFPENIDYNRYIEEAKSILYEIGYLKKVEQARFF